MKYRAQSGFTLIEIMVVVVIIGVLAGLVVTNVTGAPGEARLAKMRSDIGLIEGALELYHLKHFDYPETLAELEPDFLKRLPTDAWKRDYRFDLPGEHGEFDVWSAGRDDNPGGEGLDADVGNWQLR